RRRPRPGRPPAVLLHGGAVRHLQIETRLRHCEHESQGRHPEKGGRAGPLPPMLLQADQRSRHRALRGAGFRTREASERVPDEPRKLLSTLGVALMKISEIHVYQYDLPVKDGPYRMSHSDVWSLATTLVKLVADNGVFGWGETCPVGPTYAESHATGA